MIKINLLREKTAGTHRLFTVPTASKTGLMYAAILLLGAGIMGAWSCHIHREVSAATKKRAELLIKETKVQKLKVEIEKCREMKQLHQSRIERVRRLKENRAAAVLLLNTVLQSIPQNGNLWLVALTQTADGIDIAGFAQQTEAIPDLMSNLMDSGIFEAVNLQEIESQKEASKFSLVCRSTQKERED